MYVYVHKHLLTYKLMRTDLIGSYKSTLLLNDQ